MFITNVHIIYKSNYNGCSILTKVGDKLVDLRVAEDQKTRQLAEACFAKITSFAYTRCDREGEYQGEIPTLELYCAIAVQICFGDVDFSFEEDYRST